MGYFSNGSEGMDYQEHYCAKCVHDGKCVHDEKQSCPVWLLHLLHNYEECNKPDSFLHVLIPRTKEGNGQCALFLPLGGGGLGKGENATPKEATDNKEIAKE
jgi:hypothetical protein